MVNIGSGTIRVLSRLAIDPSIKQKQLAKSIGISRSAINQHWKNLHKDHNFRIQSNLDYGHLGFHLVYGWMVSAENSVSLNHFSNFLFRSPFTISIHKSLMSSKMDYRIFFQALVPTGGVIQTYLLDLGRFTKKPYSLDMSYSFATSIANHLNFGNFEGTSWSFESGFRFQASIDAAKNYASILPAGKSIYQSRPQKPDISRSLIASALEKNYHESASAVTNLFRKYDIDTPSERTLRRRLNHFRKSLALAYIELDRIGLAKHVIVTLKGTQKEDNYKLLQAQSITFPKVRVLSASDSIVLILQIPEHTDWFHISGAMANVLSSSTEMCTFIAEEIPFRRWLEDVVHNEINHHRPSKNGTTTDTL